ncbi:hypothetical protein APT_01210 [Acetobacter pasteurianus NBRC 101655]|nr:hypothetical protein APT_01210 [Acetobacter pasteurianus NBRC 101655]
MEVRLKKNGKAHYSLRVGAVYALHKVGSISDAQLRAAEDWARDYETGILGGKDPQASKQCGKSDAEYAILSRIAAADRCRYIEKCLGKVSEGILIKVMIECLSLNEMALAISTLDEDGKPKKEAKRHDKRRLAGMIDLLLEQLAEAYSRMPDKLFMSWTAVSKAAKS